ncbi:pilus assembly protein PilM [Grimontia kaedaensis]|uniref:Pilus assembly protein PilM n=1 Tax=Grimontia kaedaensis TaxID=2872157 RepID=A0ABY4WWF4_9GAMM|nr:pilus assembly protein PilM [Grimontia kaedaensis]USH02655.1 pilus assembly protein PilM [Grimontia kaedaensis]
MFAGKTVMGIDVGAHSVRAAMIQKRGKALKLQALVVAPRQSSLDDSLKSVKKQLRKACSVPWNWPQVQIMGVPQSNVAMKRFPASLDIPEHEQYVQVGLQLSESLGLPMDELLYDFRLLPENDWVEVYACRKPMLRDTLSGLKSAGFSLSVIELQTHALMRLYKQHMTSRSDVGASLMVDVGTERLQICLGEANEGKFYRELPVPFEQHDASTEELRALYTQKLAETIQRQYQLASTQLQGTKVSTVWLSGDGAKKIDIFKLEAALGWRVRALNPLQGLSYSPKLVDGLNESAVAWSTSIGLALRGVMDEHQY